MKQIFELFKGAKRPQYNFNFLTKIGGRSYVAHSPTAIVISHFQFVLFLSLASYRSYGEDEFLATLVRLHISDSRVKVLQRKFRPSSNFIRKIVIILWALRALTSFKNV